jgi:transcriptional regulator with XRE-family HTH domain
MERTQKALIEKRKALGLTQKKLAALAGISVHTVCQIEQGTRGGSELTWKSLENAIETWEK